MFKVSLIIPVYNAEPHIEACLAALIAQTMDEIEVLLIDDHGRDSSMVRAQQYIDAHPSRKCFRLLATPHNMGPGPARNIGIAAARGEYVGFVDSDDIVEPDYCELLYKAAYRAQADLAYCQASLVAPGGTTPLNNPLVESSAFEGKVRTDFLTHYKTMMWTFLYRRSLLCEYDIQFPATRSAEDSCMLTCSLLASRRVACVDKPLYRYIVHEESLSEVRNPKRYIDKLTSFDLLMQFAHEKGLYEPNKDELDYIYLKKGYLLSVLTYIYNEEYPLISELHRLYNHLLDVVPDYAHNPHYRADRKLRMLQFLIRRFPRLASKVLPWYIRKTKMKL